MNKEAQIKAIVNDTKNRYYFNDGRYLVHMMLSDEPIDKFKKLWDVEKDIEAWEQLLHMTHCEVAYTRVGGDEGYLDDPPINHEYINYLETLIEFLESKGLKEE